MDKFLTNLKLDKWYKVGIGVLVVIMFYAIFNKAVLLSNEFIVCFSLGMLFFLFGTWSKDKPRRGPIDNIPKSKILWVQLLYGF